MTQDKFLLFIKSRGAILYPAVSLNKITIINSALQKNRCAVLPIFMMNLYEETSGINLGNAYVFGPNEIPRGIIYPIPSIVEMNQNLPLEMQGKTVFGRNDLFWFAFDALGVCFMLDNLNLKILRKYEDPYKALIDCLIAGKL